eukprot:9493315-Pyramimonas_sp.AAC.1
MRNCFHRAIEAEPNVSQIADCELLENRWVAFELVRRVGGGPGQPPSAVATTPSSPSGAASAT